MKSLSPLEKELETELLDIYEKCRACRSLNYRPNFFKRMLTCANPRFYKGPVGTVCHLMTSAAAPPGSGFERLARSGKLNWTVEWLITSDPKWLPLFRPFPWVIINAKARIARAQSKANA
jgi:hypothetical protein